MHYMICSLFHGVRVAASYTVQFLFRDLLAIFMLLIMVVNGMTSHEIKC